MPPKTPKTHFSIPLKKAVDAESPALHGRRTSRNMESIPLNHASRRATSGNLHNANKYAQKVEASGASDDTVEMYPLLFVEPTYASDDDGEDGDDVELCDKGSNVCLIGSSDLMNYVHYVIDSNGPMAPETCTIP